MADSEVRQKFEVASETPDAFEQAWKKYNSRGNAGGWEKVAFTSGFGKGFEAGMRAGESAQLEKLLNELSSTDFTLHSTDGDIAYSAIGEWLLSKRRALPAAPEEKKP